MLKTQLLAMILMFALMAQVSGRRLHFEESVPAAPAEENKETQASGQADAPKTESVNTTTTTQSNSTETATESPAKTGQGAATETASENTTKTQEVSTNTTQTPKQETSSNETATSNETTTTASNETTTVASNETTTAASNQTSTSNQTEANNTSTPTQTANDTTPQPQTENSTTTNEENSTTTTPTQTQKNETTTTETKQNTTTAQTTDGSSVSIQNLPTLTTKQLTLNLSSLKFPDPKPQGDTLNISGISISKATTTTSQNKCQNGYTVSSDGKNCELVDILLQINLDAENLILGDLNLEDLKAKQAEFKTKNPGFTAIQCSGQTPFLSKQGCIACKDPNSLFSLKSLKCSRCPEQSTYNAETKNCETSAKQYVSNVNAENYLVLPNQSFETFKQEIEKSLKQNSKLEVCPLDRPYSIGSECVSCPIERPYFFIASKSCVACQPNSTYDASLHSCLGKQYKVTTITKTSTKSESSSSQSQKSQNSDEKEQTSQKINDE